MPAASDNGAHPAAWSEPLFASLRHGSARALDVVPAEFGEDFAFLEAATERWLLHAPGGSLPLRGEAGAARIAALVAALESGFLGGAADRPPPEAVAVGIATELPGEDGAIRYELTDWGRRGIGLIFAAARALRRHVPGAPALSTDEFSGLLLATLPLLELPDDAEGIIQFEIEPDPPA